MTKQELLDSLERIKDSMDTDFLNRYAIEGIVKDKRITHMDAVIWYCDENGLDPSQVSSLISKSLKEKIQVEASNLNMLKIPKCGVLPI